MLAVELRKNNITLPELKESVRPECVIRKHKLHELTHMHRLDLLTTLYIDDGALSFNSRRDSIVGTKLSIDLMAKLGSIVRADKGSKESKTKTMFFTSTNKLKR